MTDPDFCANAAIANPFFIQPTALSPAEVNVPVDWFTNLEQSCNMAISAYQFPRNKDALLIVGFDGDGFGGEVGHVELSAVGFDGDGDSDIDFIIFSSWPLCSSLWPCEMTAL